MDQNQSAKSRTLKRLQVGGLPLIHAIAKRMRLKEILYKYIPAHGNEDIPAVETLMLLVYNLILGKDPLYELQEWVESIDFRCINNEDYENVKFTDDKTHIETWNSLLKITGCPDFLYVADCKLCTDEQLSYIVDQGGRAVTIIPETWNEVESFKEKLRKTKKAKDNMLIASNILVTFKSVGMK